MPTPMNEAETTRLLEASLAVTKVAQRFGVAESLVRRIAGGLGAFPEVVAFICASEHENQQRDEARIRRHNAKRRAR